MQLIIKDKQSLLDIGLLEFGNIESAFEIALFNGLSVTSPLMPGQGIRLPEKDLSTPAIKAFYRENNVIPATDHDNQYSDLSDQNYVVPGYWTEGYSKTK